MKTGTNDKERGPVTGRISGYIPVQIDGSLRQEEIPMSRTRWIIEALVEKLKGRDTRGESNGTR
jgi:hypothetical protein